jgi:hypothetical protein
VENSNPLCWPENGSQARMTMVRSLPVEVHVLSFGASQGAESEHKSP